MIKQSIVMKETKIVFFEQSCKFDHINFLEETKKYYKDKNIIKIELIESTLQKRIFKVYYD